MGRPLQAPDLDRRVLILECAISLFASAGFAGVSMREIAAAVGITPAALYHHFANKQALHLEAMRHAYEQHADARLAALAPEGSPEERLERFVATISADLRANSDLRLLMQREYLDGDEQRLRLLVEHVFRKQFDTLMALAKSLAPQYDPHLLVISIFGLVMYHFETTAIRYFLPGYRVEHDDPAVIAQHVVHLILHGVARTQ